MIAAYATVLANQKMVVRGSVRNEFAFWTTCWTIMLAAKGVQVVQFVKLTDKRRQDSLDMFAERWLKKLTKPEFDPKVSLLPLFVR